MAMAMYAMVASLVKDTGMFTPPHHTASLIASDGAMNASVGAAASGKSFHFVFTAVVLGSVIHMAVGAGYGALYGLIAARLDVRGHAAPAVGISYGGVVAAASAFVGLPVAAAILGSGDQIATMAETVGWGTFLVEHLIFGLALGVLLGARRVRTATRS